MTRSLTGAMKAFVAADCDRTKMNVPHWAATYRVGGEDIRAAWEAAMTDHSRQPQNTYCEGK